MQRTFDRPFGLPLPVKLHLPYPPTANHIWIRAKKGMRKSDAYTLWLNDAGWLAKSQRPGKVIGSYLLSIDAARPDKRKRDIDNLIKPVSDLLMKVGVIADDSLCAEVRARWVKGDAGIRVTIEQMGE